MYALQDVKAVYVCYSEYRQARKKSFRHRATNYRVLLRKMTYEDKASHASSLHIYCIRNDFSEYRRARKRCLSAKELLITGLFGGK